MIAAPRQVSCHKKLKVAEFILCKIVESALSFESKFVELVFVRDIRRPPSSLCACCWTYFPLHFVVVQHLHWLSCDHVAISIVHRYIAGSSRSSTQSSLSSSASSALSIPTCSALHSGAKKSHQCRGLRSSMGIRDLGFSFTESGSNILLTSPSQKT